MSVYRNYDKIIKNWSENLPPWHSLVYCLVICKRSTPLYFDFANREAWGDKDAVLFSHELLLLAINSQQPEVKILENCLQRLEEFTPDNEDFIDCGFATDAGIIHIYSVELLKQHNPENVYYVARYCYEIVDQQISQLLMPNGGVTNSYFDKEVEQHAFLQSEICWQNKVRDEITQLRKGDINVANAKIFEWIKTPLLR